MNIRKWFHHLLNPHCNHCRDEYEREHICKTCEILQNEIAMLHRENDRLLDAILNKEKTTESSVNMSELKPIKTTRFTPWNVKREQLESNSRHELLLRQEAAKNESLVDKINKPTSVTSEATIEELEKEILEGATEMQETVVNL